MVVSTKIKKKLYGMILFTSSSTTGKTSLAHVRITIVPLGRCTGCIGT